MNVQALTEQAIVKMLEDLDPHSVYFSAEELKQADEPLNGNFEGIGCSSTSSRTRSWWCPPSAVVLRNASAFGRAIGSWKSMARASPALASPTRRHEAAEGPQGHRRASGRETRRRAELITFDIVRDKIPIYSIDAAHMVDDKVGYIKVSRFAKPPWTSSEKRWWT